jgi:hypothetical protein
MSPTGPKSWLGRTRLLKPAAPFDSISLVTTGLGAAGLKSPPQFMQTKQMARKEKALTNIAVSLIFILPLIAFEYLGNGTAFELSWYRARFRVISCLLTS